MTMTRNLVILLACIFAFPIVTRTALIQTELTYNVRNAKGVHRFAPYLPGAGLVNRVLAAEMRNGSLSLDERLTALADELQPRLVRFAEPLLKEELGFALPAHLNHQIQQLV